MTSEEKLYRVWGEYLKYPPCCVEDFVERVVYSGENVPAYMSESVYRGSGFIPCTACHNKTKGLSKEDAAIWLGRDPFSASRDILQHFKNTLSTISQEDFKVVADKWGFDLINYRVWLEDNIDKMEEAQ